MPKIRNLLISIGTALLIIFTHGPIKFLASAEFAQGMPPDSALSHQAQLLTNEGFQQLNHGQAAEALTTWEKANHIYQKLNYQEGVTGTLINQSLALQDLGLNLRACNTLIQALKLDLVVYGWLCNSSFSQPPIEPLKVLATVIDRKAPLSTNIIAWQNLGDILLQIGKADESELVLEKALDYAKHFPSSTSVSNEAILLSLANTEWFIFNQLRDKYPDIENPVKKDNTLRGIQQKALLSLNLYHQLNQPDIHQTLQLKSQLNCLALLLETEKWSATQITPHRTELFDFHSSIKQQIRPLIALIQQNHSAFSQLPANRSVLAQLNFATSLSQIPDRQLQSVAIQYAQSALQTAETLGNTRLESNSLGVLGNLYNQANRSQSYLEKASSLAQAIQAWDLAWQWQSALGNVYQKQGHYQKAVQVYELAIDNLDQVRSNLLSINSEVQFSFREKVEPVYRDYMRLLLSVANPMPEQVKLDQITQINERLQLAQLENYLRCGKLNLTSLNDIRDTTSSLAIIHIIDLGNQIEVIIRSTDRLLHHYTPDPKLVRKNSENFLVDLQESLLTHINGKAIPIDEQSILPYSQALYQLLIAPAKENKYLPERGTLIFVLDSFLQKIPMSMLHDGQNYLVKNYSTSVALSSQVPQPKALQRDRLKALIAGISQVSPSFAAPNAPSNLTPLPDVETEVTEIKENTVASVELLNKNFTTDRFKQEISTSSFPIVHISTHGQFSSDPEKTVILDWDQAIDIRQLNIFLKDRTQSTQNIIELLVLSACQTAKGDKRSALGIAGVAVQAGARSTVASLWVVEAESNALLMRGFYQRLKNGLSKAESLRQTQLALLEDPKYSHPYFWAPFILVGSWL